MVVFLKVLAIAAVGGVAFVFMRPHVPILPPALIGKRRRMAMSELEDYDEEALSDEAAIHEEPAPPQKAPRSEQPSPQAAASPAPASPTKQSSLYQVTENELVVHELLLQGDEALHTIKDFSEKELAERDPVAAISRGVAAVAERAFWDALGDGLRAEPPQWERLVVLLGDARDSLAALIPPGAPEGARLLASLSEKLDTAFMRERLQAGYDPQYLHQLFDFLVYTIGSLEAPARSKSTKQARLRPGYAEIVKSFAGAASSPSRAGGATARTHRRVRVSLETNPHTEVPVSVTTREPWLPVDFRAQGGSPERPAPATRAPSPAPSDDWVVHMGGAEDAGQGHAAPRRAPSPAVGAPVEAEEVEVRFGIPVASDRVSVQLLPASPSRPLTPAAPAAHATPHAADRGDGEDAAGVLAGAARFVFDKIAELRTDLAKARLEMLKGILQGSTSGVQYERRRLTAAVGDEHPACALPHTAAWLRTGLQKVGPAEARKAHDPKVMRAVVAEALLALVQRPSAINANDNCPETLLLDAQRLVAAQNELQRLSLVGASLLVAQMLLGAKGVPAAPGAPDNRMYYAQVKEAFAALLAKEDVRMPHLTAALAGLLAARLAAGPGAGAGNAPAPPQPSPEDTNLVSRLLMRIFSVDDVIYKKVQAGVVDALRALLAKPPAARSADAVAANLRVVGAELIQPEVTFAAGMLDRILSLNVAVCAPFYEPIIKQLHQQPA